MDQKQDDQTPPPQTRVKGVGIHNKRKKWFAGLMYSSTDDVCFIIWDNFKCSYQIMWHIYSLIHTHKVYNLYFKNK